MAISQRLDMRQSQSLVMTPQLQQAIKLLQLSNLEVTAFVEQELEQNPLLERDDPDAPPEPGEAADNSERPAGAEERPLLDSVDGSPTVNGTAETPLDMDSGNLWTDEPGDAGAAFATWGGGGRSDFDDPDFDPDQNL